MQRSGAAPRRGISTIAAVLDSAPSESSTTTRPATHGCARRNASTALPSNGRASSSGRSGRPARSSRFARRSSHHVGGGGGPPAFATGAGCDDVAHAAKDERAPAPAGDKPELARRVVAKYAFEAFPQWATAHPDTACPARIDELYEYVTDAERKDPWGQPYKMLCGDQLPRGARGIAISSPGPDGVHATSDDIKSWEE